MRRGAAGRRKRARHRGRPPASAGRRGPPRRGVHVGEGQGARGVREVRHRIGELGADEGPFRRKVVRAECHRPVGGRARAPGIGAPR